MTLLTTSGAGKHILVILFLLVIQRASFVFPTYIRRDFVARNNEQVFPLKSEWYPRAHLYLKTSLPVRTAT